MRTRSQALLQEAYGHYAVGAFNVCNLEQIHGLFKGAQAAQAPILVQFTRVIRQYANPAMLESLLTAAERVYPDVVFAVHLDHGDEAACADALKSGHYSSVMMDASHLPFDDNARVTRRVVDAAHAIGVMVEAELGVLKGIEDGHEVSAQSALLTDPAKAREFVERTGCDSLAVAIGTSHGAYKFTGKQRLAFDRLAEIQQRLPGFPLVLHGGSSVPIPEIERINASGGALDANASGVAEEELRRAVGHGVCKVNIGTDGRLIWTRVHREYFKHMPGEFDFMLPGRVYVEEFARFVEAKCRILGAAGKATRASITASSS